MTGANEALWLDRPGGAFRVGPAPVPVAGPGEVVVRARAVAVNPADVVPGVLRRLVYPWLRYPAVLGTDVAGEVVEVGAGVDRFGVGDRVVGLATGQERFRNSAAHGAFQRLVVLAADLVAPVPDAVALTDAAVLPLALTTAAAGLFEPDQLALALPVDGAPDQRATVLVWGASTSVGNNAVQLAVHAGYRVVGTASPRNADRVRALGAADVVDHHDPDAEAALVRLLADHRLAGALAIGEGSLARTLRVVRRSEGRRRIASAQPGPGTVVRGRLARLAGVRVSTVWGGTPALSPVGPAVWARFLPAALADGRYRPSPDAEVVGDGLVALPEAFLRLRRGVSGQKVVVTLP